MSVKTFTREDVEALCAIAVAAALQKDIPGRCATQGVNDARLHGGPESASPESLCSDCPPEGWTTDRTRCDQCQRRKQCDCKGATDIAEHQPWCASLHEKTALECTCPSGQSGHSHASWCLRESSRDQAGYSLEEMFPLTFEEIERNRACLSKAWLIQAELVEALEEIAASGTQGDQQIASDALARVADRKSRKLLYESQQLVKDDGSEKP